MVYKFSDGKTGSGVSVNDQLAKELHNPVIKKFKSGKIYARFKENIWATDLDETESLPSKNEKLKFIVNFKTNPWTYKTKDLKGEKITGSFYEKELFLRILQMSYYPELDDHIRGKAKVVLGLSNYATKKNYIVLQVLIHLI